jgi:hypothetical protein
MARRYAHEYQNPDGQDTTTPVNHSYDRTRPTRLSPEAAYQADLSAAAEDVVRSMLREHATAIAVTVDGVAYTLSLKEEKP